MTALADVQARIDSVGKLRTVVGAMRGIAATHSQQARGALAGYRAYGDVIAAGLARAVDLLPPDGQARAPGAGTAVVVFAAEHGLAGAFSERVLDAAAGLARSELFVLGARGEALAGQRGWRIDWSAPMASQAGGVGATARRAADALYDGFLARRFERAVMVFARLNTAARSAVVVRPVLPIDPAAFARPHPGPPPLVNLPARRLVERLVGEYVFAELALAALESFASENAARLETMEAARLNIEEKLDQLGAEERLLRQEQITAEVQEVSSGALAAEAAG